MCLDHIHASQAMSRNLPEWPPLRAATVGAVLLFSVLVTGSPVRGQSDPATAAPWQASPTQTGGSSSNWSVPHTRRVSVQPAASQPEVVQAPQPVKRAGVPETLGYPQGGSNRMRSLPCAVCRAWPACLAAARPVERMAARATDRAARAKEVRAAHVMEVRAATISLGCSAPSRSTTVSISTVTPCFGGPSRPTCPPWQPPILAGHRQSANSACWERPGQPSFSRPRAAESI